MKKSNIKSGITLVLTIGTIMIGSGCNKMSKCDISYDHAHKFVTSSGIETYWNNERVNINEFNWTDEAVELNSEIQAMTELGLIKISDNEEALKEWVKYIIPFVEYEYVIKMYDLPDRSIYSSDPQNNKLTGNMRDVTPKFHAYNFYKDKAGKFKAIKSKEVDDIFSIASEYPYVKLNDLYELEYSEPYKDTVYENKLK